MASAHYTAGDMVRAVRDSLDEAQAAFWTDAQILRYLSRAAHAVHTECRKLKADYHMLAVQSTDPPLVICGEDYSPQSLRIQPGVTGLLLPPDLLELKLIESITPGMEGVVFDLSLDVTRPAHRASRMNPGNRVTNSFLCDVVGERYLSIAPTSNITLDIRILYISSCCIQAQDGVTRLRDFTVMTDQLLMPSPLNQAIEAKATAYAHLQDRNPSMAATWEGVAMAAINRTMGADARQTQNAVFVEDFNP